MHDDVQTVLPLDPELKALNQDSFNMKKFSIIYIIAHILILITYVILGVYTSAYSIDGFIIPSSFIVFIIITLISLIFYGGIYGEDDIAFKEADELRKEKEKYRKERIRLKKIIDKGLKI